MLLAHHRDVQELAIEAVRLAQCLDQIRVRVDVGGFTCCKAQEHHANFRMSEVRQIVLNIAIGHINVALRKQKEDVGQEVGVSFCQTIRPIANILMQRHLTADPVHTFVFQPRFVRPGIAEGLE